MSEQFTWRHAFQEIKDLLGELGLALREFTKNFEQDSSERVRAPAQTETDVNGNATIDEVYKVPVGMEFRLTRLLVAVDGKSYASMFTNANGSVEIRRNGDTLIDGFNLSQGIPNSWSASGAAAPHFRNGERVTVVLTGGPASTGFSVKLEGDLYPRKADPQA